MLTGIDDDVVGHFDNIFEDDEDAFRFSGMLSVDGAFDNVDDNVGEIEASIPVTMSPSDALTLPVVVSVFVASFLLTTSIALIIDDPGSSSNANGDGFDLLGCISSRQEDIFAAGSMPIDEFAGGEIAGILAADVRAVSS